MYVLALVTQKGGSGKSTLAVGLAVAAIDNGSALLIAAISARNEDARPHKGCRRNSSSYWVRKRQNNVS